MFDHCFIRLDGKYIKVHFEDIVYIEAHKNYPRIHLRERSFIVLITMKQLESRLPSHLFYRVHRSLIVSLKHVSAFDSHNLYISEKAFPLPRNAYKLLQQKLFIIEGDLSTPPLHLAVHYSASKGDLN